MTDTMTIVGVIGTPPKVIETSKGAMTSFRVASTQRRLDRATGQWVDASTNWYSVNAFRELGRNALASFNRGDRVIVSGRVLVRPWESGSKSGTDVIIAADALGHELTWGVSKYSRKSPVRAEDGAQTAAHEPSDDWASEGPADPIPDPAWSTPGLGREAEAVGASLNSDGTPF